MISLHVCGSSYLARYTKSMQELHDAATQLQKQIADATNRLAIDDALRQKAALDEQVLRPDFWNDPSAAQTIVKQQAKLAARVEPWVELRTLVNDVVELVELADASLQDDL